MKKWINSFNWDFVLIFGISVIIGIIGGWVINHFDKDEPKEVEPPVTEIIIEKIIIQTESIEKQNIEVWESLGTFKITAYCPCEECCGKTGGITASGTKVTPERTIAVDPNVIPLGTVVKIGDIEYVAEDTGGAIKGNHIDIYFDTHDEALQFGVTEAEVFIKRESTISVVTNITNGD